MSEEFDGMAAYWAAISKPDRNDPNWPLPSFDARDWAKAFCDIANAQGHVLDEGWMISWFANALMRGYDEAQMRRAPDYAAGAEAMREAAAIEAETHAASLQKMGDRFQAQPALAGSYFIRATDCRDAAAAIRALPLPEPPE